MAARLRKELVECAKDEKLTGISVKQLSDPHTLEGQIQGPPDSPYEGGFFKIHIQIPKGYPFEPPKMKFKTKIWHPNISSQTGAICLDILKDNWSPALTLKTALLSVQALLTAAEPDDPQDAQVARQYKTDYKAYCSKAQFWTQSFACGKEPFQKQIKQLMEMGFSKDRSAKALAACDGSVETAMGQLFNE